MTTGLFIVLGIIALGIVIFGWFPGHWFMPDKTNDDVCPDHPKVTARMYGRCAHPDHRKTDNDR